jgi:H+/Na+-translocating ferredoxin:NAD+ oxidoreductase subunit D
MSSPIHAGKRAEGGAAPSRSPLHRLVVAASPHLKGPRSTPVIMWNVVAALMPVLAAATWYFGPSALLVTGASTAGALLTERGLGKGKGASLADGSAAITGLLLGLTLPAGMPMWMAALGGFFAIAFGKLIFGGLGFNVFNPALLGRAFLQAAFPVAITTWPATTMKWWALRGDNFAMPFMHPRVMDAVTAATPLGLAKFEGKATPLWNLMLGTTGGSLGETAGLIILLCGAWLALQGFLNWRIPASIFATVALFATILHFADPATHPNALVPLFSGGLMLGAVFMATDPVTAPATNTGRWIFGALIGALVMIIRVWGGLPEGVMYAILLGNTLTPFISRATQPRVFGTSRLARGADPAPAARPTPPSVPVTGAPVGAKS